MTKGIADTAYQVLHRDGKVSMQEITPNPLLEYTKSLVVPPEEADPGSALLMASYERTTDIGTRYSGLELWRAVKRKEGDGIPFSELAKDYACIGICSVGGNNQLLFPTVLDLLAFLSQYSGVFAAVTLTEISQNVSDQTHSMNELVKLGELLKEKSTRPVR